MDVRSAATDDVDILLDVLAEAAAWLLDRGIDQWPARFDPEWVRPALERGETWLGIVDGDVVGTVTVQWEDELVWPGAQADAGYVHRLAVRRRAAGRGGELLTWAEAHVVDHGKDFVRLDCWSGNDRLRAYYEARGYARRGERTEHTWSVARYEKVLRA